MNYQDDKMRGKGMWKYIYMSGHIHQGVIRCMIGFSLEIPITKWYLINVPHGYPIQFIELNSKYLLNTDRKTFSEIMKNFNAEI